MKYLMTSLVLFSAAFWGLQAKEASNDSSNDSLKGLTIAKKADAKDAGFGSYTAKAKMDLISKKGKVSSTRTFAFKFLEVPGDADKALTSFLSGNVKGSKLLSHGHKDRDDDQWIYLPALKRDKRILSRGQTGSFLGSEFSFEDMRSPIIEKFSYKFLREEKIDRHDCHLIERIPLDKKSGYKKQLVWLDKSELRIRQIHYYDRRDKLFKVFTADDYKQHKSKYWRPNKIVMKNLKNGRSTLITYSEYNYDAGLKETDFQKSVLKRP